MGDSPTSFIDILSKTSKKVLPQLSPNIKGVLPFASILKDAIIKIKIIRSRFLLTIISRIHKGVDHL